jgi:Lamin Tail Domain
MRHIFGLFIATSLLLGITPSAQGTSTPVVINEIDCHRNDWIELVNRSSRSVDLSKWMLSDKEPTIAKANHRYVFAAGTVMAPHEYLVVQQSGIGLEHLPFGIPCAGGQTVYLSKPSEGALYTTVETVPVPKIPADLSYGRIPTGTGRFSLTFGTKAASNSSALPHVMSPLYVTCRKKVVCVHRLKGINVTIFRLVGKPMGVQLSRTGLAKLAPSTLRRQTISVQITGPYGAAIAHVTILRK